MRYTVRLILALLFVSSVASAQWRRSYYSWQYYGTKDDSLHVLPKVLVDPALLESGAIRWNPSTLTVQVYNGATWEDIPNTSSGAFIKNQNTSAQSADFYISGNGRINNTLRIATTNTSAAPLHVGTLPSYANLSAVFEGNVQTIAATANSHAVTLGQTKDSLNTKWSVNGNAISSGQFIGSTNSANLVLKANNDTGILINTSKQVFADTTFTVGDYTYNRKPIPGDPPHVFEVTTEGSNSYLMQITNFSNTTGLANFHIRKARGTKAAPSAVQYGDALSSWGFRGYGSLNFSPSAAAFIAFAREPGGYTDSAHGSEVQIQTTAVGANAWYGRTYAFVFGADGKLTIPRGVSAVGDNNVATLTSLTDYGNSYLQFNNSNATRRGYVGMFGNTNQLTISADAGTTGTPTVRITNRLLVNTAVDNGNSLNVGGAMSATAATFTGNTAFSANGTPAVGKIPVGTDASGNWTWQTTATLPNVGTIVTGDYTADADDNAVIVNASAASSSVDITLPASAGGTNTGRIIRIYKINVNGQPFTIGGTTFTQTIFDVVSSGSTWTTLIVQ